MGIDITVVTVVKDDLVGLRKTYQSLVEQDSVSFQWVVIDGRSEDGTPAFLASVEPSFGFTWISEADRGIYDAMNKGISLAQGELIIFLNAGDRLSDPQSLQRIGELLETGGSASGDVFYGGYYLEIGGRTIYRPPRRPSYIRNGLPTSHQAIFYPREFCRLHPYPLEYRFAGDYYLTALAFTEGLTFHRMKSPISRFAFGGTSATQRERGSREMMAIQKRVLGMSPFRVAISRMRRGTFFRIKKWLSRHGRTK